VGRAGEHKNRRERVDAQMHTGTPIQSRAWRSAWVAFVQEGGMKGVSCVKEFIPLSVDKQRVAHGTKRMVQYGLRSEDMLLCRHREFPERKQVKLQGI